MINEDHDNALDDRSTVVLDRGGMNTAPEVSQPPTENSQENDNGPDPDISFSGDPIDLTYERGTFEISIAQEETRGKIALYFTYFFLMMVLLAVVSPFALFFLSPAVFSNPIDGSKDLLTLISSVLAGPFGFIVGFYFKQGSDNR